MPTGTSRVRAISSLQSYVAVAAIVVRKCQPCRRQHVYLYQLQTYYPCYKNTSPLPIPSLCCKHHITRRATETVSREHYFAATFGITLDSIPRPFSSNIRYTAILALSQECYRRYICSRIIHHTPVFAAIREHAVLIL